MTRAFVNNITKVHKLLIDMTVTESNLVNYEHKAIQCGQCPFNCFENYYHWFPNPGRV